MVISIRKIMLAFVFSFSGIIAIHAQPTVQSSIDSKQILIGQQINLRVVADMPPQDFFVKWIQIPDSLQHFELVEKSKIDSAFTNQKLTRLAQTFTFTSFDSGKWMLPAFEIHFNPSTGGEGYTSFTDTFLVNVSFQFDSTIALRDIKDVRKVNPFSVLQLLLMIGGALTVLSLLAWLIYFLLKKTSRKNIIIQKAVSAYESANIELEKLMQLNLSEASDVRIFHTRLKEILKTYLSSIEGPDFTSSTTSQVLIALHQQGITKTIAPGITEALYCSDATRFAKYFPSVDESKECWKVIKHTIDLAEKLKNKKMESDT
jgi:hypothetical protein